MKFLCDRCKTRYSIGDERVRGKILKIRCKNCANVITVREGMPEPDAVPAAATPGTRRSKDTTEAPTEASSTAANGAKPGALGAAFASAMTKPPPALEEEWYVSIEGDQAGPFSLGEAQRWVSGKPFDAELHCWSEGFDDWLPVDKVSHFRGLRKKPAAPPAPPIAAPPPIPKISGNGTGPARAIAPRIPDEEHTPKPLFAATMASLEKSAAAPQVALAGPASAGGAAAVGALRVEARAPAKPSSSTNGSHGPALALAGAAAAKFDASEPARSDTHADDEPPTTRADEPPPQRAQHLKSVDKKTGPNDAFLDALAKERNERKAAQKAEAKPAVSLAALEASSPPAPTPIPSAPSPNEVPTLRADAPPPKPAIEEDDMEIGEVSRVVNLADLMRQPKRAATQAGRTGAIGRVTGPVGRVTGPVPKLGATGAVPRLNATAGVPLIDAVDAIPGANPTLLPPEPEPEKHSRRGLILLLVGAALLLGAGAVILVVKLNSGEDVTGLGGQYEVNTERPDLVVRRPGEVGPGSAEAPQNPFIPKQPKIPVRPQGQGSAKQVDPVPTPAGNSLKTDEIEAMARSTSSTTTACFRRASKGADDIILSDVKKIRVAFKVNPDGTVAANSVDLSEKRSATLSSCLQRMVAGWKFRPNAGGDFGFILAKPD